jgi:AcrR family transcriptional regulator
MTDRGAATRAALIEATRQVVQAVGYTHATTRAIAEAAGVAEGTIYRHFADKSALFFAAVLDRNATITERVSRLPARAGHDTVEVNLTDCLVELSGLREDMLPLELALLTDADLARQQRQAAAARPEGGLVGPPMYVAAYLAAEQSLGRVRGDVDPAQVAVVLLATLFGLALVPSSDGNGVDRDLLASAVRLFTNGIAPTRQHAGRKKPASS